MELVPLGFGSAPFDVFGEDVSETSAEAASSAGTTLT